MLPQTYCIEFVSGTALVNADMAKSFVDSCARHNHWTDCFACRIESMRLRACSAKDLGFYVGHLTLNTQPLA